MKIKSFHALKGLITTTRFLHGWWTANDIRSQAVFTLSVNANYGNDIRIDLSETGGVRRISSRQNIPDLDVSWSDFHDTAEDVLGLLFHAGYRVEAESKGEIWGVYGGELTVFLNNSFRLRTSGLTHTRLAGDFVKIYNPSGALVLVELPCAIASNPRSFFEHVGKICRYF